MNRVVVQFKPRFDDMERAEDFELTLSKKMSYEQVRTYPCYMVNIG